MLRAQRSQQPRSASTSSNAIVSAACGFSFCSKYQSSPHRALSARTLSARTTTRSDAPVAHIAPARVCQAQHASHTLTPYLPALTCHVPQGFVDTCGFTGATRAHHTTWCIDSHPFPTSGQRSFPTLVLVSLRVGYNETLPLNSETFLSVL